MQKQRLWRRGAFLLFAVLIAASGAGAAFATTSNSSSYQVTETQFGAGSSLESCSDEYCARVSIGDMEGGSGSSATMSAEFGSITSDEPLLEVIVDPGESNLGVLTTESTATKTMIVRIRNYLSNGYTLQIVGNSPVYEGRALSTFDTPTISDPGTEQFGINAVANTSPSVGADPEQVPSGEMSFGTVEESYSTPNLFKYVSGDVVARSLSESGRTDYTISMIVNVSGSTPAGHYASDFSAVVVPVY